jgi:hypothetical protein
MIGEETGARKRRWDFKWDAIGIQTCAGSMRNSSGFGGNLRSARWESTHDRQWRQGRENRSLVAALLAANQGRENSP